MQEDLRFIPMIARALTQPDRQSSLREVFAQVEAIGQTPGGRSCYQQFLAFMYEVQQAMPAAIRDSGQWLTTPWARSIRILLECQGEQAGIFSFPGGAGRDTVAGIVPGDYRLVMDTGWLLWEGHLSTDDLFWSAAFPEQPLPMAADTEDAVRHRTRQVDLLDGSVILRTYAGLEAGLLQIEVVRTGAQDHGQ